MLYDDPSRHDTVRLAPVYDITNTTAYIPEDRLALSLSGDKGFFVANVSLYAFAKRFQIRDAHARVERLLNAAENVLFEHADLATEVPDVTAEIRSGISNMDRALTTQKRG